MKPDALTPREVAAELRRLLDDGARLRVAGEARSDPAALLRKYRPAHRIDLFDTAYYLSEPRQNPELRFFVAYVVQVNVRTGKHEVFSRIFYKDISLIWRAASHFVSNDTEFWIGKGDMQVVHDGGYELYHSMEETTDLPLEIQDAVEQLNREATNVRRDWRALELVLRNAPSDRIKPYKEFTEPRRVAQADRRNLINGGKRVARFTRAGDPTSLEIVRGFEPDFGAGLVGESETISKLYRGTIRRYRILSKNRKIQWMFMAAPEHAWIVPPQATTVDLSSFGVRTIDVAADDDLFVPGYEYHFMDDAVDPPTLHSQIPEGYVGDVCPADDARADASPWLERLSVIKEFRRAIVSRNGGRPRRARRG